MALVGMWKGATKAYFKIKGKVRSKTAHKGPERDYR
jgi:hypothetical protein